jgi:hypothetical protein
MLEQDLIRQSINKDDYHNSQAPNYQCYEFGSDLYPVPNESVDPDQIQIPDPRRQNGPKKENKLENLMSWKRCMFFLDLFEHGIPSRSPRLCIYWIYVVKNICLPTEIFHHFTS